MNEDKKEEIIEIKPEEVKIVEPVRKEEPKAEKVKKQEEPKEDKNGLCIASMVLGIISIVLFLIWFISIPCAILAVIFGCIGIKSSKKGMAIAGIVTGSITGVLMVIIFSFLVTFGLTYGIIDGVKSNYNSYYHDEYFKDEGFDLENFE